MVEDVIPFVEKHKKKFIGILGLASFITTILVLPKILGAENNKDQERKDKRPQLHAILIWAMDYKPFGKVPSNVAEGSDLPSVEWDKYHVDFLLGKLAKQSIFTKINRYEYKNEQASVHSIKEAISKVKRNIAKDDVVLFYYSGHGATHQGKQYLSLPVREPYLPYRESIVNEINKLNCRLKIVITESCSVTIDLPKFDYIHRGIGIVEGSQFFNLGNRLGNINNRLSAERYKDLFLKSQGLVDISSSDPNPDDGYGNKGTYAWGTLGYYNQANRIGGFFTFWFMMKGLIQKPTSDWKSLFESARQNFLTDPDMGLLSIKRYFLDKYGIWYSTMEQNPVAYSLAEKN